MSELARADNAHPAAAIWRPRAAADLSLDGRRLALLAGQSIGDIPSLTGCEVVVEKGWLVEWDTAIGGARVISAIYISGDVVARDSFEDAGRDTQVTALIGTTVVALSSEAQRRDDAVAFLASGRKRSLRHLREHVRSLTVHRAERRILHLLVSLWQRLLESGEVSSSSFRLPLTQAQISDMSGMSLVHTNKSIARMKARHEVSFSGQIVTFPNPKNAVAVADVIVRPTLRRLLDQQT